MDPERDRPEAARAAVVAPSKRRMPKEPKSIEELK